ncbi:biotin transporter BioY [Syntrophomonas palmitatica]|uniref:biotin transporter BioY n=1 Tax=Syntrophomonas palmitatica TaxID=402877 RepID=UPI0006D00C3D|nr:biotin transporter BioY [Syntrophomonas palmitatica]
MVKRYSPLRQMVYASMFGALTAVGAFIVIPLQPVPITLQTFFTGLAGVLLGGYAGALSQIVYVLLGIIGLPVFAGGQAGLGTLFGPTGGYLIGFIAAAFVIGKIVEARRKGGLVWIALALIVGDMVIYTLGILQLCIIAHFSLAKALLAGVVPFLLGDLLKLLAAVPLAVILRKYFTLQGAESR